MLLDVEFWYICFVNLRKFLLKHIHLSILYGKLFYIMKPLISEFSHLLSIFHNTVFFSAVNFQFTGLSWVGLSSVLLKFFDVRFSHFSDFCMSKDFTFASTKPISLLRLKPGLSLLAERSLTLKENFRACSRAEDGLLLPSSSGNRLTLTTAIGSNPRILQPYCEEMGEVVLQIPSFQIHQSAWGGLSFC